MRLRLQEVTEYVNQLSGYVDRFINYTVEQVSILLLTATPI